MNKALLDFVQNPFDNGVHFKKFVEEIFCKDKEKLNQIKSISLDNSNHILSYAPIAKEISIDDKELHFYIFEVSSIKAKIGLHTELKEFAKNIYANAILACFYEKENQENFRLSLLTLDFKNKKLEHSNLKRQSFILGKGAKTRTALSYLPKLKNAKSIEDLQEAFAIETLNKEFFTKISQFFLKFIENTSLPTLQKDSPEKRSFVLRLFSRILFCKFLEKKEVIPSKVWDTSLSASYYHDVLESLFFKVLNTPKNQRDYGEIDLEIKNILEDIPYLNGGLFAPHDDDFFALAYRNTLKIPNDILREFLEMLDEFHFTIDESTPLDQEVGLDPEMLGMVFENLLSVLFTDNKVDNISSLRKKTGSYYTPREIVSYMVKSSILEHLKDKTNLDETKLKTLVFDYSHDFKHGEILKIMSSLQDFKVLDPACGSGAFPIGMLQEICSILEALDPQAKAFFTLQSQEFKEQNKDKSPTYIRKLSILQNNIYGVDIQPMATEISRLRCFLSLICDEDKNHITPLPNLEFKFITANSLIPMPKNDNLLIHDAYTTIKKVMTQYFASQDKEALQKKYREAQKIIAKEYEFSPLAEYDPFNPQSVAGFFDSELMFEVKEFDCVIGNPPYRDYRKIDKKTKEKLNRVSCVYQQGKKGSIFVYFIERSKQFVKEDGLVIFINPISYICKPTDFPIRNFINNHLQVKMIVDISNLKIFKEADTYACINLFKKSDSIEFFEIQDIKNLWDFSAIKLQKINIENLPFSLYPLLKKIQNNTTIGLAKIANIFCALSKTFRQDICTNKDKNTYQILESSNIFKYKFSSNIYIQNISNYYTKDKIKLFLSNQLVFMARMTKNIRACIAPQGFFGGKVNIIYNTKVNQKFLLGLLNSRVMDYFYSKRFFSTHMSGGAFGFDTESVGQLPIPKITESNQATADKIIALVEKILALKESDTKADTSAQEREIDNLVYTLYSLTEEEIKIIEGEK